MTEIGQFPILNKGKIAFPGLMYAVNRKLLSLFVGITKNWRFKSLVM